MKFISKKVDTEGRIRVRWLCYSSFFIVCTGSGDDDLFRGRMTILILHYFGKNAILGKLKLTIMHFHQIQEITKEDGTQTARVFYHCM